MAISDIRNQHNDGSARSDAAQKRARDAVASPEEKQNVASTAPSEDAEELSLKLRCPITLELPVAPVMAEDGKIYEAKAIRDWFETKGTQLAR